TVASNLVKFGIQFLLLLGFMIYFGIVDGNFHFGYSWLLIPVLVIMMAMMGLGLGIIISSMTTKYRDLNVLLGFGVQLLMYATPVAYPMSFLRSKSYAAWIQWNPLSPIVEAFRYALFGKGTVDVFHLVYSFLFILIVLFVGLLMFNKVEKTFMDTV
ncbi:MAG TPA: ABC transporter permease, partial [Ginsengibacter sp.]|nr:ABC transporter permease [Ginsengibacter sp.]